MRRPRGPSQGFATGTWQGRDGPWQKNVISIERSTVDRPADLIGTMAHELSHERLLGEGRADRNAFDNELLTDLTTLYHGFGAFLANNPRKSTGELSRWPGSNLYRPEYISEPMLGYALAHIAWFRDESRPVWVRSLRSTPRAVFRQGLRYLQQTGDSTFKPVRLRVGATMLTQRRRRIVRTNEVLRTLLSRWSEPAIGKHEAVVFLLRAVAIPT